MKKISFLNKLSSSFIKKYDYSLIPDNFNYKEKIKIICKIHGSFYQMPHHHIEGQNCPKCCKKNTAYSTEEWISLANKIHKNKFDYSQVKYVNQKTKVKIECSKHGVFYQLPPSHILGKGCPKCSFENLGRKKCNSLEIFIEKANKIHHNYYDYSKSIYIGRRKLINIICLKHGEFTTIARLHLLGRGCPTCKCSKGELKIKRILDDKNINYRMQYSFDACKNPKTNRRLKFDFYLPDYNLCIEYDGEQHFYVNKILRSKLWGGEKRYLQEQYRDSIKNNFCIINNITLLRIPYTEKNNIQQILKKYI